MTPPKPPARPSAPLAALRTQLQDTPAAVYSPAHDRTFYCPNIAGIEHRCDREKHFTIPEAQLLAARLRAGELGPLPPAADPIVLAYGMPWTS